MLLHLTSNPLLKLLQHLLLGLQLLLQLLCLGSQGWDAGLKLLSLRTSSLQTDILSHENQPAGLMVSPAASQQWSTAKVGGA